VGYVYTVFEVFKKLKKEDPNMSELVIKIGNKKLKRIMRNDKNTIKKPEEKISSRVLKQLNIPEEFH